MQNIEEIDPLDHIIIKGARVHNLKNIDVVVPRNKLTVITGLSGSGKSSLAFETLYAEGQRRYVESLSAYARQFLGKLDKPDVDYIKGISPAIAVEQKVNTRNPRSTVGISTEIYDYMKLLFARVGRTYSPVSGLEVKCHSVSDVVDFIAGNPEGTKGLVVAKPVFRAGRNLKEQIILLSEQGFSRVVVNDVIKRIDEISEKQYSEINPDTFYLLIDRFVSSNIEDQLSRFADSAQTAFYEGGGYCEVWIFNENEIIQRQKFSNKFEADGIEFEQPSANLFSFNNPYGACKVCEGFGWVLGIDEDLVVPDKSLSVYEGAVACWKGDKLSDWKDDFIKKSVHLDFPVHRAYFDLNEAEQELLWKGNPKKNILGIDDFFRDVESQTYKIQYRVLLSRYRGRTVCPDCRGSRLRKDANYVKIDGKSITDFVLMSVDECSEAFEKIQLDDFQKKVGERLLLEIKSRLRFLRDVGLGYLTLNRRSNTLSGGESQRINLATSLGSSLVGSMYILDEPSIGLHSRDTEKFLSVITRLRDLGNSVIVVEHDEDIMKNADHIVDIGPLAGRLGGEVVFSGSVNDLLKQDDSLTAGYLSHKLNVPVPKRRRKWTKFIEVKGARENNLKNVSVKFPLEVLTVVSGVSGSGKTSLVKKVLFPALQKMFGGYGEKNGSFDRLEGNIKSLSAVEMVDQNPIGKSSRSNPVTYLKAYDEIRNLFSLLPASRQNGLKPAHFSFNVPGGRCDTCEGEGYINIEMQFMADVNLLCDACHGKRFKEEILEVTFKGKNISDVLDLTVDEAMEFFQGDEKFAKEEKKISDKIKPLQEVGLGYVKLGQSSSTLSGGEAQRIKLASFLSKGYTDDKILFIFDEPTTGLHFHDINNLMKAFNALIDRGHSLLIIEHNMEIIKCADWVIDIGPDGGNEGGNVVFEGTPEDLVNCKASYTAKYLKDKL